MIRLATILLLLTLPLSASQLHTPEGKRRLADTTAIASDKKDGEQKCNPPTVIEQQTVNCGLPDHESKSEANQSNHAHDWIDNLNAFSTLIIAVFTILLFVGVVFQVSTSRDTERAWIIANLIEMAPPVGFVPASGNNLETHTAGCNQRNVFSRSFKNTGNTPARLVEAALLYRKVSRLEDVPEQPD
jgi:hypothetical protein